MFLSIRFISSYSFLFQPNKHKVYHRKPFQLNVELEDIVARKQGRNSGRQKSGNENDAASTVISQSDLSDASSTTSFSNSSDTNTNLLGSIPPVFQNYLRDSGILRTMVNIATRAVAGPAFYYDHPHCFPEFIRISEYPHWLATATRQIMHNMWNFTDPRAIPSSLEDDTSLSSFDVSNNHRVHFRKEMYGTHPNQMADVMAPENHKDRKDLPIMIFLHGGAWGSGFPTMYRLISTPFLRRGYRAIVLGYRTYPDSNIEGQIEDLTKAIHYFREQYMNMDEGAPNDGTDRSENKKRGKIVLIGHSSGAHISMMAALKGYLPSTIIDRMICMSGVYDLELARENELAGGVSELSPMGPVCGEAFKENSPTWIASRISARGLISVLPPLLLLHGGNDTVALPIQSELLHRVLSEKIPSSTFCKLDILERLQHQDLVLDTCLGRDKTQQKIFDWLNEII